MRKNIRGVHILLSAKPTATFTAEDLARIAIQGGASVIQLREKEMDSEELLPIAKKIREICNDITFIVNDRIDIAKFIEADGVHVGQEDMPIEHARIILGENAIIGKSCSSIEEARQAEKEGADYIGFGHMFPTFSKIKSSLPRSVVELKAVCNAVKIPVIAIGGISLMNAPEISLAPIGGFAVLSTFSNAENPNEVIRSLVKLLQK